MLEIGYGSRNGTFPQYGVLDLRRGYLRLNPGPPSGWGTSIIVLPSFWSTSCPGGYCQGAPVVAVSTSRGPSLVLTIRSTIGGLSVTSVVQLDPPTTTPQQIHAHVTEAVPDTGGVTLTLGGHSWEAFKPVMLSSMHVSSSRWDASAATAGGMTYPLPSSTGWINYPPVNAQRFGLVGGTSTWKTNAPTVEITLDTSQQITGWLTSDTNPEDENVGYWAATTTILSTWSYDINVSPAA